MYVPAAYIFDCRTRFFADFSPIFMQCYQYICQSAEVVALHYHSPLQMHDLPTIFIQNAQADRSAGRTTAGIHKDEVIFWIDAEKPLKKYGSQGQQKSYIIALKLAQYHYIKQKTSTQPLLLLDDIFEKLDKLRLARLMLMVANDDFAQIFITDTDGSRVQHLFDEIMQPVCVVAMG
jgi:DNA replication and repair protein RecF